MRLLSSRRFRWAAVLLLVAVSLAGFVVYRQIGQAAGPTEEPPVQTATVRQGDLVIYASGSGTLTAETEISLGFENGGTLGELLVAVGDTVEAGQVLARVDDATARGKLLQAQVALRELTSPAAVAAAQLAVADAREALQTAEYQYNVQQEGNRATSDTLKAAKAKLVLARAQLDQAKDRYDSVSGLPSDDPQKAQAYLAYLNAKNAYNSALGTYNWYTGHPTDIQQAQLEAAVAVARASLEEAQALLATLTGEDLPEVAYGPGLTAVENARQAVGDAQADVDATELTSPLAGIVTAVGGTIGQSVSSSVITMVALQPRLLEINLDQSDFDKIHVGDEAEIVFDALPEVTFTGTVTHVDPTLTTGMVSTIRAIVEMEADPTGEADRLLLGMSAAVDVISGRATGATLVPVEALRELSPGEYAVFVMIDGTPTLRPVEVGLMDVTYGQIVSGVEPGDVVTTGLVETE